jgi:2-polyprenyl-6-methoxyphenol hydroxylase-like FAD-dependent oxidoreductase
VHGSQGRADPAGGTVHAEARTWLADLIVAADGADSAVRAAVAPASRLGDAGHCAWRAVVQAPAGVPADLRGGETLGRGYRFGIAPLLGRAVYWYACAPGPVHRTPPEEQLAFLHDGFGRWHAPIPDLIATTRPANCCTIRSPTSIQFRPWRTPGR